MFQTCSSQAWSKSVIVKRAVSYRTCWRWWSPTLTTCSLLEKKCWCQSRAFQIVAGVRNIWECLLNGSQLRMLSEVIIILQIECRPIGFGVQGSRGHVITRPLNYTLSSVTTLVTPDVSANKS